MLHRKMLALTPSLRPDLFPFVGTFQEDGQGRERGWGVAFSCLVSTFMKTILSWGQNPGLEPALRGQAVQAEFADKELSTT